MQENLPKMGLYYYKTLSLKILFSLSFVWCIFYVFIQKNRLYRLLLHKAYFTTSTTFLTVNIFIYFYNDIIPDFPYYIKSFRSYVRLVLFIFIPKMRKKIGISDKSISNMPINFLIFSFYIPACHSFKCLVWNFVLTVFCKFRDIIILVIKESLCCFFLGIK